MTDSADIVTGQCAVWQLPHTPECAKIARNKIREALSELLPETVVNDCTLMVSELATNGFIHGLGGWSLDDRGEPDVCRSELAIYRRGTGHNAELVITIFDSNADLDAVTGPVPDPLAGLVGNPREEKLAAAVVDERLLKLPDATLPKSPSFEIIRGLRPQQWSGGRGLNTVRELSKGRCGFYRTTSRRGAHPGKVAWFAIPILAQSPVAHHQHFIFLSPTDALTALRSQLSDRGIDLMIRNDLVDCSVLTLRHSTILVTAHDFTWHSDGEIIRHPHADLTETVEQLIRINEDREHSNHGVSP